IAVEALADHPAYLPVIVDPATQEFGACIENEVALHFLPYILKFVVVAPDVVAGAGDDILTRSRDVQGRAWFDIRAYVSMTVELADRLGEDAPCRKQQQ